MLTRSTRRIWRHWTTWNRKNYGGKESLQFENKSNLQSNISLSFSTLSENIKKYSLVQPGSVSPAREVPDHIQKPPYLKTLWKLQQSFLPNETKPEIKTEKEIEGMRDACKLARNILTKAGELAKVGITTDAIDEFVHAEAIKNNAYPSPLLYRNYPKSVCTSVNNVACHGIPDDRPLEDGDIINIDVTVYYNGFHGDCSETFHVGDVDTEAELLVLSAQQCRDAAIEACGPGESFQIIGDTIGFLAGEFGYSIVSEFCGHGIGSYFHGPPDIIHVPNVISGRMLPGMTFTIEPVISEGGPKIKILDDGWTAVSVDGSRSAQFEHTILITQYGVEILTQE